MTRRSIGLGLVGGGSVLALVGLVGLLMSSGDEPAERAATTTAATTTTAAAPAASLADPAPTSEAIDPTTTTAGTTASVATTAVPTTTSLTTTAAPTTAAPTTTTTTTVAPATDRIAAFIGVFADAIAAGDVDALMASLHPDVVAAFGAEVCRSFVETEILALGDYELIGDITGPLSKTLDAGGDSTTIENIYEAEVRFTFQGTEFEVLGDFVAADAVYWVAICR